MEWHEKEGGVSSTRLDPTLADGRGMSSVCRPMAAIRPPKAIRETATEWQPWARETPDDLASDGVRWVIAQPPKAEADESKGKY